jgi:RimJ/RimL family protein N-acetyltransferase
VAAVRGLLVTGARTQPLEFPVDGITDGQIRIRLRADADDAAIVAACQDPEIPRWTRVPEPYDEGSAAEWSVESQRQREAGEGLHLVIADADTDELLGSIGVQDVRPPDARCDIGYWLARQARGRGVMTRAVGLLSRWVFDNLPIERIQIAVQPENRASRAVAERAGYAFEGILRSYIEIKGTRCDAAMYSLLRADRREPDSGGH